MTSLTRSSDTLRHLSQLLRSVATDGKSVPAHEVASLAGILGREAAEVLRLEVEVVTERCAAEIAMTAAGQPLPRHFELGDPQSILRQLETVCRVLQSAARKGEPLSEYVSASLATLVRSSMAKAECLVEAARDRDRLHAIAMDLDLVTPEPSPTGRPPSRSRPIVIREAGENVFRLPIIHRPIPRSTPPADPDPRGAA